MTTITSIKGFRRFDSRGNPTIMARVTAGDAVGFALVPSGASTGTHEALELRDEDRDFHRKDVKKALTNIEELEKALIGKNILNQEEIDTKMIELDGTENKSRLGANAILAISMATIRTAAKLNDKYLFQMIAETYGLEKRYIIPTPMFNILNGGVHTNWESTDFQEYMIVPFAAKTFSEKMKWGVEIYHELKILLKGEGQTTLVGDEGGFAPRLKSNDEAIELVMKAIEKAGYKPGEQVGIALDPAVSEIYDEKDKHYFLKTEHRKLTTTEMISLWEKWTEKYPIFSIEDGLGQDDWDGWKLMNNEIGEKIQLVGDDFLATNPKRIQRAINEGSANALLVKPNQIGTLTETIKAIKMCHAAGWKTVISHRSGETEDTFIADLAVATSSGQIKTGAPARSERVAKYNRLLDIEEIFKSSL